MFTDILWRFLILETFVLGALCCSCADEHPQKHFCKSEFVLLVDIHDRINLPMAKVLWIEIKKGDVRELNFTQNGSVILRMPRICAVNGMKNGDKYVIFGRSKNGHVSTNMCRGNRPWRMTKGILRRGLTRYYKNNCDCDNSTGEYTSDKECEWKFSFMKRSDGDCNWVKTISFKRCKKGLRNSLSWK